MNDKRERGQSSVEFALILPLVLVLVLALAQVGLIVQAQISVTHTAREAVRVLAVDPSADARTAALNASNLAPASTRIDVAFGAAAADGRQIVEVTIIYVVPHVSAATQRLIGDREVTATAAMLVEEH